MGKRINGSIVFAYALLLLFCWGARPAFAESEIKLSADPSRLFDIPFYFSVPIDSWRVDDRLTPGNTLPTGEPIIRLPAADLDAPSIGLRLITMHDDRNTRSTAAKKLYDAGLLQDGDIVLTFHPAWANTMAYPHVQMGISHTGLIVTRADQPYNLDMPLNEEFDGADLTSQLNSEHYLQTDTLHFVRSRTLSTKTKANLRLWAEELRRNYATIHRRDVLPFNSDYLSPRYAAFGITPLQSVDRFAGVLKAQDRSTSKMAMFCSEFAWHMLTLASRAPSDSSRGRPVTPIFTPKNFVQNGATRGLAEGPLLVLQAAAGKLTAGQESALINGMFAHGNAAALSSGHQQVAHDVQPLMETLQPYYTDAIMLQHDSEHRPPNLAAEMEVLKSKLNSSMPANFSPTSFLVGSLVAPNDPDRTFDYLYTLTFTTDAGYDKALQIAKQQRGRTGE